MRIWASRPRTCSRLEPDAGLGNGGLGRLAACYLDSMTTLEIPATGYSICYELGIFKQKIIDGQQVELADTWQELGDAWLMPQAGRGRGASVSAARSWTPTGSMAAAVVEESGYTTVLAVPHDMKIAGYQTDHVNILRLWDAKSTAARGHVPTTPRGEYLKAVEQPGHGRGHRQGPLPRRQPLREGKSLRLKQQYFFVSATVQSIVRKHLAQYGTLRNFHEKHVIQINDTHPTLVIPELMRILLDEEGYELGRRLAYRHSHRGLHQPHRPG